MFVQQHHWQRVDIQVASAGEGGQSGRVSESDTRAVTPGACLITNEWQELEVLIYSLSGTIIMMMPPAASPVAPPSESRRLPQARVKSKTRAAY